MKVIRVRGVPARLLAPLRVWDWVWAGAGNTSAAVAVAVAIRPPAHHPHAQRAARQCVHAMTSAADISTRAEDIAMADDAKARVNCLSRVMPPAKYRDASAWG